MKAQSVLKVAAGILGVGAAFAIRRWPEHAKASQMMFYSLTVLGIMFTCLWTWLRGRKLVAASCALLLAHGTMLIIIQKCFPFHSGLAVIPLAFIELMVLLVAFAKLLFESQA